MEKQYMIGGSPCCGKSTIAKRLAEEMNLYYFEADEYMEYAVLKGKADGKPNCIRQAEVYGDEKWLRDPMLQAEEELALYEEIFPYVMERLELISEKRSVIAEGAVFLPMLIRRIENEKIKYCCMVPEEKFQVEKYRQRTWVKEVLRGSSNFEASFGNWMKRDSLFAGMVFKQAANLEFPLYTVADRTCENQVYQWAREMLGL